MKSLAQMAACSSGFGVWAGSAKRANHIKAVFDVLEFIDYVHGHGLGGIEFPPLRYFDSLNSTKYLEVIQKLNEKKMFLVIDSDLALNVEQIKKLIPYAKKDGNGVLRIKTSNVLGCQRHLIDVPWDRHVDMIISKLREVLDDLDDHQVKLAIENHQDLDSHDLLRIIETLNSPWVGLNWDIGNSLASCEMCHTFLSQFKDRIFHAHLKDYKIYSHPEGFGLSRCALGDGVVDFKQVLNDLSKVAPKASWSIELGAHNTRWVQSLSQNFWEHFVARNQGQKDSFFQYLDKQALRSQKLEITPWERGQDLNEVLKLEKEEFEKSLIYCQSLATHIRDEHNTAQP